MWSHLGSRKDNILCSWNWEWHPDWYWWRKVLCFAFIIAINRKFLAPQMSEYLIFASLVHSTDYNPCLCSLLDEVCFHFSFLSRTKKYKTLYYCKWFGVYSSGFLIPLYSSFPCVLLSSLSPLPLSVLRYLIKSYLFHLCLAIFCSF